MSARAPRALALLLALGLGLGLALHSPSLQAQTTDHQAQAAYTAASAALQAHNWGEAELQFERVLMFAPQHAEARIQLALLLARQGNPTAAAGFIQSLVEDPRTPAPHRTRLQTLLAQLNQQNQPDQAAQAAPPNQPTPTTRYEAKLALATSTNPHTRADISSLTLTLPQGNTALAINQTITPALVASTSLSALAPNQCGADLHHQGWGGPEPQTSTRLLLWCPATLRGHTLQLFATTHYTSTSTAAVSATTSRSTLGASWPQPTWRLSAQLFIEPEQQRQGYALRLDHLLHTTPRATTLVFAEAEHAATGLPGFAKLGLQHTHALGPTLAAWVHLSYQQDLGPYSPLLAHGAPRTLLQSQLGLEHTLGTWAGWQLASAAQITKRKSNIELFEFSDLTVKITFKHVF